MMAAESSAAASTGRCGGSGASADSYIGSLISLTSKSEIRYEGVLHNINTEKSSIGLLNVRSFGTEGRKKDGQQVPPSDKIYEYILFRGSDIKDLQVKASPPVQTTTSPINSDPAIIQSHYHHPTTPSTSLPTAPSGSFTDLGSHSSQLDLPGSNFQSGLPLYQPGANLNSGGPSPPNANGSGLAMPMYWQGFYGTPNGMPQMPQQSLLRPPPGSAIPPPMQQMQFSSFNPSLPMTASSLPSSKFPEYPSIVPNPNSTSSAGLTSSSIPVSTLSLNVIPLILAPLVSGTTPNLLPNKAPASTIPSSTPSSNFPALAISSTLVLANAGVPSVANTPNAMSGTATLSQQTISLPVTDSATWASVSVPAETMLPSLVTPGQLLKSGPASVSSPQLLRTTQEDVEVVQVLPKSSSGPPAPVVTEARLPILPLPTNTKSHKHNGAAYHMRNNFSGRGGRGSGISRPVTKFTEDFDFMSMNEKFNKDEVWGHLGRSNKSQSKDKEINGSGSDEYDSRDEDDVELRKVEIKPGYNKGDFFDSISSNTSDNDPNHGRTRYSEQMKVDTQTFGDFSWIRGLGRGGRFRGTYYGRRGYVGYGYAGRSRGLGRQNHAF